MALPFGARPEQEPQPGTAESAPARPRLWLKALAATLLAAVFTLGLDWALDRGLIVLRPDVRP
jgi:Predicted secreted protein